MKKEPKLMVEKIADAARYGQLCRDKAYMEMTDEELEFCNEIEIDYYKNSIEELRNKGIENYKIAAYIHDIWMDYLIYDETKFYNEFNISLADVNKGYDYYQSDSVDIETENPLRD